MENSNLPVGVSREHEFLFTNSGLGLVGKIFLFASSNFRAGWLGRIFLFTSSVFSGWERYFYLRVRFLGLVVGEDIFMYFCPNNSLQVCLFGCDIIRNIAYTTATCLFRKSRIKIWLILCFNVAFNQKTHHLQSTWQSRKKRKRYWRRSSSNGRTRTSSCKRMY